MLEEVELLVACRRPEILALNDQPFARFVTFLERAFRADTQKPWPGGILYPLKAFATFVLVMIGWVFFRAADRNNPSRCSAGSSRARAATACLEHWHFWLLGIALVVALLEERFEMVERIMKVPSLAYAASMALMLFCLDLFGVIDQAIPFVYFQF